MLNRQSYVDPNKKRGTNNGGDKTPGKKEPGNTSGSAVSQIIDKLDVIVRGIDAVSNLVGVVTNGINDYRRITNERIQLHLDYNHKMFAEAEQTKRELHRYEKELRELIESNNLEMNKLMLVHQDRIMTHEEKLKALNINEKQIDNLIIQFERKTTPLINLLNTIVDKIIDDYRNFGKTDDQEFNKVMNIYNLLDRSQTVMVDINTLNNKSLESFNCIE